MWTGGDEDQLGEIRVIRKKDLLNKGVCGGGGCGWEGMKTGWERSGSSERKICLTRVCVGGRVGGKKGFM